MATGWVAFRGYRGHIHPITIFSSPSISSLMSFVSARLVPHFSRRLNLAPLLKKFLNAPLICHIGQHDDQKQGSEMAHPSTATSRFSKNTAAVAAPGPVLTRNTPEHLH